MATYLHSFYTGIENILKEMATGVWGRRPSASRWHSELLSMMADASGDKPALLSQDLANNPVSHMGFRHVFRQA